MTAIPFISSLFDNYNIFIFSGESHEVYSGVKIIQANGEQSKSVR